MSVLFRPTRLFVDQDSYKSAAKKAARPTRPPDARCIWPTAAPVELDAAAELDAAPLPLPLLVPVAPPLPFPLPFPLPLPLLPPVVPAAPEELATVGTLPTTIVVFWPGSPTTVNEVIPAVPLYVMILVPLTPAGTVATAGCVVTTAG